MNHIDWRRYWFVLLPTLTALLAVACSSPASTDEATSWRGVEGGLVSFWDFDQCSLGVINDSAGAAPDASMRTSPS